jgi:hypothetical protein
MNVLTTTWHQLVRRRLWPVAVLLVAALAAVPVLLSRNASPVPPPESTSSAPAENAKTDDALAKPVVAKASTADRSRRRRVLGARKDPFTPEAIKHPKKVKKTKVVVKKTQPKQDTSSPAPSPSSPAPSTPVTTPVVTTPAPKKKTYAKGSLIVRFGDAEAESLKRINVKKLGPLPDDTNPLLVYMGLTDHGKKAVFMVDASLEPTGDGDCRPHPSNCETIELAVGETEFFDATDEETGDVTTQYELDLVDIK